MEQEKTLKINSPRKWGREFARGIGETPNSSPDSIFNPYLLILTLTLT